MKQWTPATVPPEEGRVLLLCLTSSLSSVRDLVVARFVSGRIGQRHPGVMGFDFQPGDIVSYAGDE
jgi:hypothetical protein